MYQKRTMVAYELQHRQDLECHVFSVHDRCDHSDVRNEVDLVVVSARLCDMFVALIQRLGSIASLPRALDGLLLSLVSQCSVLLVTFTTREFSRKCFGTVMSVGRGADGMIQWHGSKCLWPLRQKRCLPNYTKQVCTPRWPERELIMGSLPMQGTENGTVADQSSAFVQDRAAPSHTRLEAPCTSQTHLVGDIRQRLCLGAW